MARIAVWLLAIFLVLVGAALLVGGGVLIAAGGSPYYVAAGLAVLASAVALVRHRGAAAVIYAGLLIGTLLWSLWEVGLDGWQLAPRLVGPAVVGLAFLLLPKSAMAGKSRWWIGAPVLAIVAAIGLAAGLKAGPPQVSGPPIAAAAAAVSGPAEWRNWGNTVGGTRYVPVSQINASNVANLKLAWRYDSDVPPQPIPSFEGTPLNADGRLYVCLQPGVVAALDPDTGRRIWRYTSPGYDKVNFGMIFGGKCRGVSYYQAPHPLAECQKRILFTDPSGYLRAVDAATGQLCKSFGDNGAADMRVGMGPWPGSMITAMSSSPPAIVNGVAVVGQTVSDMLSLQAPSGVVRGYDAETGTLKWAWDAGRPDQTLPKPGQDYTVDTPNAWGPLSGDEQLGLVFVPTGGSLPDYYGGARWPYGEKVGSAVVAIDVATGKVRWVFQTVHHDVWDYDIGAQPVAVDLPGPGAAAPALLVPTKLGQIFVLDRRTGQPIDPVVEHPVPQGAAPGERLSPTQPFTTGFPSLAGPRLRESDMWGMTPLDQMWCRIRFKQVRYEGPFTPHGLSDSMIYPSNAGGIDWGSVSIDIPRGLVVVNTDRFSQLGRLIPREQVPPGGVGRSWFMFQMTGTPYVFAESPFLSPIGVPCQAPPFGTINVLDLKTRKLIWSQALGQAKGSGPFAIPSHIPIRMGVPNQGGSVVTAGGVFFIAASQDHMIRAYETATGRELWSTTLPAVSAATPMTYVSARTGRQYVVIQSGGHYGIPGPPAGAVLAFALPR